jgi:ribosomal protein S12 methylthiotransferase
LQEVEQLDAREIVLIAQDLAAYGVDESRKGAIVPLIKDIAKLTERVRMLYLYPSDLTDELIDTICETGVPYFDLSLQHVSKPLLRRMRRWGDAERFLKRVEDIRAREPQAAFRSNFIVGYPGETEEDHDLLLKFVEESDMEWISFFTYSPEEGTYAMELDGDVPSELVEERIQELRELQDRITARKRAALIGDHVEVLIDEAGVGRSHREAPEIDGIIEVPDDLPVGTFRKVEIIGAAGPDLEAR